ncbi:thioredoxin domain-containing protein [Murdochiella vaginalis]|uniref:thioredoxin domain-containing protein n=1 Tax=Murdochiella vaginalis TaxID=1852373 RepID=UPI0012FE946B|nr:thioredoxin family protein [Murdochiella vaginalis]
MRRMRTRIGMLSLALLVALSACGNTAKPKSSESVLQSVESSESSSAEEKQSSSKEESDSGDPAASSEELTEEQKTYEKIIATYPAITMKDVNDAIEDKEELLFYAGRVTCPYCVKFTPTLKEIVSDNELSLSALDTTKEPSFLDFADKHGIEYIPAVIYIKDGEVRSVKMDDPYPRADVEAEMKAVGIPLK